MSWPSLIFDVSQTNVLYSATALALKALHRALAAFLPSMIVPSLLWIAYPAPPFVSPSWMDPSM